MALTVGVVAGNVAAVALALVAPRLLLWVALLVLVVGLGPLVLTGVVETAPQSLLAVVTLVATSAGSAFLATTLGGFLIRNRLHGGAADEPVFVAGLLFAIVGLVLGLPLVRAVLSARTS